MREVASVVIVDQLQRYSVEIFCKGTRMHLLVGSSKPLIKDLSCFIQDLRSHTYQKMKEHLQQRLKVKSNHPNSNCTSSVGSRSSSSTCNVDSSAEVDYLVRYIEGREDNTKGNAPNPKKAAKKARQKKKKV